ncbi:hypothetical protein QFZ22_001921 [Streptomyces canus]|uniref:Uncharacterized protein n=1 Tax=Streptomyces canus TaxID=58343 RepID=A0AAW8F9G2_9ACTN|nr:hypothetical protein [Streptomyces canus]
MEAAADEVERIGGVHHRVALRDELTGLDRHVQPVLDRGVGLHRHGVGSGQPVVPDPQLHTLARRVVVDAVDEVDERVLRGGARTVRVLGVLEDLRVLREVGAEHVLVGSHVPGLGREDLGVLVHQTRVVVEGRLLGDVEPGGLLVAVGVGQLEVRAVLDPRVDVPRGVDLGDDLDVVLVAERDQLPYLVLGVVAPGVGLGVGVALDLQLHEQLVELVVGHLSDEVLQPGQRDVDAGAHADAPLLVARHVDRAPGGDPVALREELEEGPGAVEGAGLGRSGDRQACTGVEFVALGTEGAPGRLDVDNDVTGPGSAAYDGDRAVARRPQITGERAGHPAFGRAVGDEPGPGPVEVGARLRSPLGQGGHRDRRARVRACERRGGRQEQRQQRHDGGESQPFPHERLPIHRMADN